MEHVGSLLCAACLAKEVAKVNIRPKTDWARVNQLIVTAACVLLIWVIFYGFGQVIKKIPPSLHEGTVWKNLDHS